MRWPQALPPFGEGRLLGWSSACTGITPRRKTVPDLVPGWGQSKPHGPCAGLPGWPAPRLCGFLAGHIPVNPEHSCMGRGACRDSHSTSKGLPRDGAGAAITPGLLLTAGEGGSQSSGCLPLGLCFLPSGPLQAVLGTRHGGVSSPVQGPDRLPWRGPRRRVECGRAARGHPGVKLSVPRLHGEQGAAGRQAGLGEEGSWGPQTWLTTLPSVLLTLGAAPPSPPASQGVGAETCYPHTPALCMSCRVNSPL